MADAVQLPLLADPPECRCPDRVHPALLAAVAGLAGVAVTCCALRLTAARRRDHRRRARQILAEQDQDQSRNEGRNQGQGQGRGQTQDRKRDQDRDGDFPWP